MSSFSLPDELNGCRWNRTGIDVEFARGRPSLKTLEHEVDVVSGVAVLWCCEGVTTDVSCSEWATYNENL